MMEHYKSIPYLMQIDGSVYSPFFEQYYLSMDSFKNHADKYKDFEFDLLQIVHELEKIANEKTKAERQTPKAANFSPTTERRQV